MRNTGLRTILNGAVLAVIILMAIACAGSSSSPISHFEDPNGTQGTQGNVDGTGGGTGGTLAGSPIVGSMPSAPLGTDPAFGTQEISNLITTTKVEGGTSAARSASSESRVLWVAITKHGDPPIAGTDAPPITEGEEVDLYIQYQVFPGELTISRQWIMEAAGLHYIEPAVTHSEAGTYQAVFPFTLAYGTGTPSATFKGIIGPERTTSVVVIPDMNDYREVEFEIVETPTLEPIHYPPANPDSLNDTSVHGEGCLPEWITVDFNGTSIHVESALDISNVVLEFDDGSRERFEHIPNGTTSADFMGTGDYAGKTIVGAWIKSGCNESGMGTGYGEYFEVPNFIQKMAMAQFAWDDDTNAPDHDYNDFVGRMNIAEVRNTNNEMVQMLMTAKAMARSTDWDASWQFNVGASFPGATEVYAVVDQYYADGTPHGGQRIYESAGGCSIPIFSPTREALPSPPGSNYTNGEPGTQYMHGDYAEVLVILHQPQPQGTYTPIPYNPQLLVDAGDGSVYTIDLWSKPGDPVEDTGYPQAFIVPDTYAWPLEGEPITNVYPEFQDWLDWINDQSLTEPSPPWWQYDPVDTSQYFQRGLFL